MSEPTTSTIPAVQVTTTKVKDPKRVEAGKRLAQISKESRERKMRAKVISEVSTEHPYGYLLGIAGLILADLSVYYARAQHKRESQGTIEPKELKDTDTVTIEPKVLDTFD